MSILDKARSQERFLEQIASAIPGFKGYREKELRRDADRLQREHLATQLEQCKAMLDKMARDATRGGSLDAINDIETARKKLDKAVARVRYADRGYAGFFDAIKVDEQALERVYQFDLGLIADVQAVQGAARAGGDAQAAVAGLIGSLEALDSRLNDREQILSGIR